MPRWLSILVLAALVAAPRARAEDLSSRLEQLERESARAAPSEAAPAEPAPAEPAPAGPTGAAIQTLAPAPGRLGEIQERRARGFRELAAKAARRAVKAGRAQSPDPAVAEQVRADERERDLYARKAQDVFRQGTPEYQEAYAEWLASQSSAQPAPE